jgi:hypothetical protein
MADLRVEHRVEFYPLACGYNGAIVVDTFYAFYAFYAWWFYFP